MAFNARSIFAVENLLNWLLVFVPVAWWLEHTHADPLWVFLASCAAIIPLAGLMGHSTEALALRAGPGVGGLLNASFGNAAELIIAFMALRAGKIEIVQASITGSIIGNLLFVLGLAIFVGGLGRERQKFNATAAGVGSAILFLGTIGLLVPALLEPTLRESIARGFAEANLPPPPPADVQRLVDHRFQALSVWIAGILLASYLAKLLFSLKTHHHLYNEEAEQEAAEEPHWGPGTSMAVLLVATALTAFVAEFLVGAVEQAAHKLHLGDVFVGVVIVAIIGNAAEHSTAVLVARKGKMNLAMTIAVESSVQIGLFVAPVLVLADVFLVHSAKPMTLHFTDFEAFAVAISVGATALISLDGESNWLEGLQLLAVYAVLGVAFYFAG